MRSYLPTWLVVIIEGIKNIIRWVPIIYKDKDWDDYYITKLLQTKIEHQRKYLVEANRHTRIDIDNYWMTVLLNLLEREHEDYYSLEKYDYIVFGKSIMSPPISETLDKYLNKYPGIIRRVMKKYPDRDFSDKDTLSLYVGMMRQEKCRNLIFDIMKRYSKCWWD